jgi:hypothetical protein
MYLGSARGLVRFGDGRHWWWDAICQLRPNYHSEKSHGNVPYFLLPLLLLERNTAIPGK